MRSSKTRLLSSADSKPIRKGSFIGRLRDFEQGKISRSHPRADFEIEAVAAAEEGLHRRLSARRRIRDGLSILNLEDEKHRGYFAADYELYEPAYLKRGSTRLNGALPLPIT